jgi:hypothetical protein
MDETSRGVVVELKVARRKRRHQDDRARQVTVAFVAAATAEISRIALARALVVHGMQILAEEDGLGSAEECALLVLSDLARDRTDPA